MISFRQSTVIFAAMMAGSALATDTISASGGSSMSKGLSDTTHRFFPQVNSSMQVMPVAPSNPKTGIDALPLERNGIPEPSSQSNSVGIQGANFPGVTFHGWYPPDVSSATGTSHVLMVVNSKVGIYSKSTGTQLFLQNLDKNGFFSGVAQTTFVFDPKCFYDQGTGRFFIVALEQSVSPAISNVLIAVSQTSNPLGSWFKYRLNAASVINGKNCWFDYPGVGYNKDGLVITGNMFAFSGNSYQLSRSFAIRKSILTSGAGGSFKFFNHTGNSTLMPARTIDSTTTRVFGVAYKTTATMTLFSWNSLATTAPTLSSIDRAIPAFIYFGGKQVTSTGGKKLDSVSDRVQDAMARSGYFCFAHTAQVSSSDVRAKVRWYEFLMGSWPSSGTPTLRQTGNISAAAPNHIWMPAISRAANGAIAVAYTRCSTSRIADLCVSVHKSTDALNSTGALTVLASSAHNAVVTRWGDYQSVAMDPSSANRFWIAGETLRSDGQWQTAITNVVVP